VGETFATAFAAVDATVPLAETVPEPPAILVVATDATVAVAVTVADAVCTTAETGSEEKGTSENADAPKLMD
tara:strand:+ start:741 stop:956 length:216 start_codon:yes stop_codon:yes gene_type:complete